MHVSAGARHPTSANPTDASRQTTLTRQTNTISNIQHPTFIQYHHPHTYPSTQTTNTPWPPASPPRSAAPPSPVPPSPTTAPLLSDVRSRPRNNGCRTPSSRRPFASLREPLGERESYICLFNLCAGSMGKASCKRRMWFAGADVGEHRLEALGLLVMDVFRGRIERRRDALWMCYYKLLGIQELTTV